MRSFLTSIVAFLAICLLALGFAVLRGRTVNRFAAQTAPQVIPEYGEIEKAPFDPDAKPFFSLMSHRTYGSGDKARLWVNYRGLDELDFRVYRVKDPIAFFKQLDNRHQIGEEEELNVAKSLKRRPTFLEKLHAFKTSLYNSIRDYVRAQLQRDSRKKFNAKFRANAEDDEERSRTPLNVADYARVPLLNPDQMVSSWREKMPPLDNSYDNRMITLGKRDPGVYLIEAVNGELRAFCVSIVTDLAMVEKTSNDGQLLVYAVDRKSGAPREGVTVEVAKGKDTLSKGTTDSHGILKTKVENKAVSKKRKRGGADAGADSESDAPDEEAPARNTYFVTATNGENFAISDLDSFYFGSDNSGGEGEDSNLTSFIYTDRPVYRSEQKVYFKGILRKLTDNGYKIPPGNKVNVTVEDPNTSQIYEKELALSSRGTFSGELDLPEEAALGSYSLSADVGDQKASGSFLVQEYKKPEFKATVTTQQKYVKVGEKATFNISAQYFFGSPVARANVKYYIYRSRAYYWWGGGDDEEANADDDIQSSDDSESGSGHYHYGEDMVREDEGRLDANGHLNVDFIVPDPSGKDDFDYNYRLEAQVTDLSRREMEGSASFAGIRGNVIANAAPEKYVYFQGDTAKIAVSTKDHEGRAVATKVKLSFVERRWEKVVKKTEQGDEYPDYDLHERELSSDVVQTSAEGKASYDYTIPIPGAIHIKTTVEETGRQIVSEGGSIWVTDRAEQFSDVSYENESAIKLVPDKKSYRPGDTAHVLALLPTDKARLLVTTEMMSVLTVRQIDTTGRTVVIDVPIEARYAPDVYLNVAYVQKGDLYSKESMLSVPARDRLLNLQVISNKKEYKPREAASYTILARNADGSPAAGAEVSFGVVDESIYSIQAETVGDIRKEFYGRRYSSVTTSFSVSWSFTGYAGKKPIKLAQNKRSYQLADFKNDDRLVEPALRKIFKDTAFWQPNVVTGSDGKASITVQLPDNLTTWRATARAVTADTRVGTTTEKIVERKNVIIRIAQPRFLTEGDTVTLSGVVHNYLKQDKVTKVSINVDGAELAGPSTQTVTIPSQGEFRVDWRVSAPRTGKLTLVAKALTDVESDAMESTMQIVPRGLRQTRGESIALSNEEADTTMTLTLPGNAEPNARALRIEVAPSIAGSLFGALDYLTGYPYGCTEQTMSQFLPTVIVAQTLKNVQIASIKDSNDIGRKIKKGFRRLYNYQHEDGGWGWWKDDATDPFMSAYVVDGMSMAKRAGYAPDEDSLTRGRNKLKEMIESGKTDDGKGIDAESRAYMVYALTESGSTNTRYLNEVFAARGNLQPYGRALLALALKEGADEKRAKIVAGEIEQTSRSSNDGTHWSSHYRSVTDVDQSNDVEATALSLKALARISPQSSLLSQAARWLVKNRRHGHYWSSTKETAFAIYGLTDYLKVSQELSPDYSVEISLNGQQILSRKMTGADAASGQTFVIKRNGTELGSDNQVRVVKHGSGMLYVSTTLIHYTDEERVAAQSSSQVRLTREYLRLRVVDNGGKPGWKVEPLSGDVHSGDLIVSRLHLEGQRARYLMIEDPIPAGCEQIEEVSGINLNYTENGWSDWYSDREFRDQRTALFVNYFDGKATYQYALRVQEPGNFRVAPARVEQMYEPDIQANSESGSLTILDNK